MRDRLLKGMRGVLGVSLMLALLGAMVVGGAYPVFAQNKTPIKIGFSIALTGGLAVNGQTALLARQIWLEDINARGGILGRPVELVYYDDQSSAATTPGIYSKLIDVDKVDILFAPYGSVPQGPVLPLAKQRGMMLFGNFSSWANEVLGYDRYFHIGPYGPPSTECFAGLPRLAGQLGFKTIAMIASDTEGTVYWLDSNRRVSEKLGIKVVYDQKFPLNTLEFSSMLRAINATKPDVVYVATYPNETVGMLNALDEVGINESVKLFGGGLIGLQAASFMARLGPKVNGIINYNFYVPSKKMNLPGTKKFLDRYYEKAKAAKIDVLGYYFSPFNYAMGQVIEQAVTGAKTLDNKVLAKYMHEHEFDTIVGKFRFGPNGEWTTTRVVFSQFRGVKGNDIEQYRKEDGVQIIVDPPDFVVGKPIMPFSAARK